MSESGVIDISNLDKVEVLMALYNNSRPLGMGFLHATPGGLSKADAERLLKEGTYFDYLQGRVMKVDLSGDTLNPRLYDRDNGFGAAERAIKEMQAHTMRCERNVNL